MGEPGYWMNEASGRLRPVITDYLEGRTLTPDQILLFRAYLRQWIMADGWQGSNVAMLRMQVNAIITQRDIRAWLNLALDSNIDPL